MSLRHWSIVILFNDLMTNDNLYIIPQDIYACIQDQNGGQLPHQRLIEAKSRQSATQLST